MPAAAQQIVRGYRRVALERDARLEVIPQVLADPWQVPDDLDAAAAQDLPVADPGELKKLGRVQRTGTEDDLAARRDLRVLSA